MGSTRIIVKLGETFENMSYTPPSPMKATPPTITSESNAVRTASVSKVGDVMMTTSSQKERILEKNSILVFAAGCGGGSRRIWEAKTSDGGVCIGKGFGDAFVCGDKLFYSVVFLDRPVCEVVE